MSNDQPSILSDPERTVCFCHNVSCAALIDAIQKGAHTLHDIQAETCASTGCGGCEYEVVEILEAQLAQSARKPAANE